MPKQLVVEQIEVTQNGTIQIRMHKLSGEGDLIGNHRTAVPPGGDVAAQFYAVNTHMATEGYQAVSSADVARVQSVADAVCTTEVIAAYQASA
ncbi:MAG: hypothetical protein WC073_11385 [Sterolibacterium sp.]